MVEIARIVNRDIDNVQFRLAGEGPEREKIHSLIESWGLENIFVLEGHVSDIQAFYRRLDVYLNTSIHEGIPMSVLEAMATGCPVIAPAIGGLPEIIHEGRQGFLVKNRNPDAFAERCIALLKDKALRQQFGGEARRRIKDAFSVEAMTEAYFNLYTAIVRNESPLTTDTEMVGSV